MVNTNVQSAINFNTSGYKAKRRRNYQPGELRRLHNAEIRNDGTLSNRRNIRSTYAEAATDTFVLNAQGIIGFIDKYCIVASETQQLARCSDGSNVTMWSPTSLPSGGLVFDNLVGVFVYNNTVYWLTYKYNSVNTVFVMFSCPHDTFDPSTTTFASLTSTVLFSLPNELAKFQNFFIQGDRVWVVTNKGIFFSKATDPLVWAVPDGGFFKFPDTRINYAMALRDTIYVLCDNAVHTITYTGDPNSDAIARRISENVGGDSGTIHKDSPYFVNIYGLWLINNNSVQKVLSQEDLDVGEINTYSEIVSFENYIVLCRYMLANYDDTGQPLDDSYYSNYGRFFTPFLNGNEMGYNVFFINTDNDTIHTISSEDYDSTGQIVDLAVNPNKDFFRSNALYMLTNRFVSSSVPHSGIPSVYRGHMYYMSPEYNNEIYDLVTSATHTVKRQKPNIQIEIDGFVPDGNEYLVKKFRNLEIMGVFPKDNFALQLAFDNQDYGSAVSLVSDTAALEAAGEAREHYPARLGVNQRGRSLSISLSALNYSTQLAGFSGVYTPLEISDMRVLWTYTGRGPTTKTPTQVT